jgi:probable addiction module antidote protein
MTLTKLKILEKAFITNDLRRICRAIDAAMMEYGLTKIAREACVDRSTLFRAFRHGKGPSLHTMVTILRILKVRLVVKVKFKLADQNTKRSNRRSDNLRDAKKSARALTVAFRSGNQCLVSKAFGETLRLQENVSEIARHTIRSREALYRAFSHPRDPQFSTALSFLNALGLRFALEKMTMFQAESVGSS